MILSNIGYLKAITKSIPWQIYHITWQFRKIDINRFVTSLQQSFKLSTDTTFCHDNLFGREAARRLINEDDAAENVLFYDKSVSGHKPPTNLWKKSNHWSFFWPFIPGALLSGSCCLSSFYPGSFCQGAFEIEPKNNHNSKNESKENTYGGIIHRWNCPWVELSIGGIVHKWNFPGGTFQGGKIPVTELSTW